MKKFAELALGIITGIGGFLEAGSIATSAQAGAEFGFRLIWVLAIGLISLSFLMEMTGRLAAVSKQTYVDLLRRRFGIRFFLLPLVAVFAVSILALVSEIGGVSIALELVTGIRFQWWAVLIAFAGWIVLWIGTFGIVEQGSAVLGLVALVFAVVVFRVHPNWSAIGAGLVPSAPGANHARYWYLGVSILGASVSPYLYLFYSAGAVEDNWNQDYLVLNRITSGLGNLFGGTLSIAVLILAALVFGPAHRHIDKYEQIAHVLSTPIGHAGLLFFAATLFITCFGATLEIALSISYLLAQGFGWEWSENLKPGRDSRFAFVYSVAIFAAAIPIALGADPLAVTNLSMVLTAASLPFTVIPLFVLMNDGKVMGKHCNGWISNAALCGISIMSLVLFFVSLPLQLKGGG